MAEVHSIWNLQGGKLHHPLISQGNQNIFLSYMKYRKCLKYYIYICILFVEKERQSLGFYTRAHILQIMPEKRPLKETGSMSGSSKLDKALGC